MSDLVESLTKALHVTDVGRRVGWAHAYAAEKSKDEMARDLNLMTGQRDLMRRAASLFYGFLTEYLEVRGDQEAIEALSRWRAANDSVFDSEVVRAGREASRHLGTTAVIKRERNARKLDEKRSQAAHQRSWKAGSDAAISRLADSYGFPNVAAMRNYLADWQGK